MTGIHWQNNLTKMEFRSQSQFGKILKLYQILWITHKVIYIETCLGLQTCSIHIPKPLVGKTAAWWKLSILQPYHLLEEWYWLYILSQLISNTWTCRLLSALNVSCCSGFDSCVNRCSLFAFDSIFLLSSDLAIAEQQNLYLRFLFF